MLKEISRTFDSAHRAIRVVVEDDFGNQLPLMFHVANLSCYACGGTLPTQGGGVVDVAGALQKASDDHEIELDKILTSFAANGADVSAVVDARTKRRAAALITPPTPPASGAPSGIPSSTGTPSNG